MGVPGRAGDRAAQRNRSPRGRLSTPAAALLYNEWQVGPAQELYTEANRLRLVRRHATTR